MEKEKITRIRKELGLTKTQFAAYMGVSLMTVNFWEMGERSPDNYKLATLRGLEKKLGQLKPQEKPQFAEGLKIAGAIGLGALLAYIFDPSRKGASDE